MVHDCSCQKATQPQLGPSLDLSTISAMTEGRLIYSASFDDSTVVSAIIDHDGEAISKVVPSEDDEVYENYELTSLASVSINNLDRHSSPPSFDDQLDREVPSAGDDEDVITQERHRSHHLETTVQLCDYFASSNRDDVSLRIQDFWTARWMRRQKYGKNSNVYGVFGLFQYLADLKLDLSWANEAAHRRQPRKETVGLELPHHYTECTSNASSELDVTPTSKTLNAPYLSWTDFECAYKHQRQLPYFSIVLFALCTLALVASFGLNDWKFADVRVNPMLGPTPEVLIKMGALDANKIVLDGEWYRILTAIILHAGIVHYAFNMLALYCLGYAVEQVYGSILTATVFVVAAVGGNIASALLLSTSYTISVGASGGLFALLGICLADICSNWDLITMRDPQHHEPGVSYDWTIFWLVVDLVISILIGLTPYVDNCIHLGGFVYALGLGLPFLNKCSSSTFFGKAVTTRRNICCRFWGMTILLMTLGLYASTSALLFTQHNRLDDHGQPVPICESCRYISCVPFPFWQVDQKFWYCDGCDHVAADVMYQDDATTTVIIACPFRDEALVDLSGILDDSVVLQELPSLCRAHCNG